MRRCAGAQVRRCAWLGVAVVLSLGVAAWMGAPVSAAGHACPSRSATALTRGCGSTGGDTLAGSPMRTVLQDGTTGGGYIAAGHAKHHRAVRH